MKSMFIAISLGLICFADLSIAEINEKARCQQLAHDYAENPDSLKMVRLRQLQFCISQTLARRETHDPPATLKGTIIEPLSSSESESQAVSPDVRIGNE